MSLVSARAPTLTQYWKKEVADTFFPIFCLGCEQYGAWLCDACFARLPQRIDQRCPLCLKQITPSGERCFACHDRTGLDGLFAASYYHSPLLSYTIHTYKYQFVPALAPTLGAFLTKSIHSTALVLPDILIPVPLHARRLRFRGFNQAELLAHELGQHLLPDFPFPVFPQVLRRTRKTKPQMKTRTRSERLGNLAHAFAISEKERDSIQGKNIWLIDDVSTTGATLRECAIVLKQAKAKSVFGIVLAR